MNIELQTDQYVKIKQDETSVKNLLEQGIPGDMVGITVKLTQVAKAGISFVTSNEISAKEWHLSGHRVRNVIENTNA